MKSFCLKARRSEDLSQRIDLKVQTLDSIYFMGICGTAMASLAVYLKQKGFNVSGSDQNIYPPMSDTLKMSGIPVFNYSENNIRPSIQLVIVGNVISKNHEEFKAVQKLKIPCLSFPEFLEQTVLYQTTNIVIAGTHGKSTSSALMSHAGETVGEHPGFFVGALPGNFSSSFRSTRSLWFVIEGDEYDSSFFAKRPKFLYYNPHAVLLTGIEFDHGDIYNSLNEITDLFCELVQNIPREGSLVACAHDPQLETVIKHCPAPVITYGIDRGDWTIKNRTIESGYQIFDICHKEESYPCSLPLFGEHNALNALGVFVLSCYLKWPAEKVLQSFKTFKGLQRRLEFKGKFQGAEIYEDFAHHPTAVKASLSALKEKHPRQKLIALFEPRSFTSRLNVFQKDYIRAFEKADLIFIAKEYDTSKIPEEKRFSSKQLVQELKQEGKLAFFHDNFENMEEDFIKKLGKNDVAVFMTSGAFGGLLKQIEKKFS